MKIDLRLLLFLIVLIYFLVNNIEGLPRPTSDFSKIETNMDFNKFLDNNKYKTKKKDIDRVYEIVDEVEDNIEDLNDKFNYYHNKYCGDDQCITCEIPEPPVNAEVDEEKCGLNGILPLGGYCQFKCKPGYRDRNSIKSGRCELRPSPPSSAPPSSPGSLSYEEYFQGENQGLLNPTPSITCTKIV